jgi:hypothetical protein
VRWWYDHRMNEGYHSDEYKHRITNTKMRHMTLMRALGTLALVGKSGIMIRILRWCSVGATASIAAGPITKLKSIDSTKSI